MIPQPQSHVETNGLDYMHEIIGTIEFSQSHLSRLDEISDWDKGMCNTGNTAMD